MTEAMAGVDNYWITVLNTGQVSSMFNFQEEDDRKIFEKHLD